MKFGSALTFAVLVASGLYGQQGSSAEQPQLEFRDGDRVTLIGGGDIERLQAFEHFEALLTSRHLDRQITIRNLGWSGDTVEGISRAVFGSPHEGFQRLLNDVRQTNPSLILVAYGANEAYEGEAGLERFESGLDRLLNGLADTKARVALVAPPDRVSLGKPLPDPTPYNQSLEKYRQVIRKIAEERGLPYVNLNTALQAVPAEERRLLSDDGVHWNAYGHWRLAPGMTAALGVPPAPWRLELSAKGLVERAEGMGVAQVKAENDSLQFFAKAAQLPLPPPSDGPWRKSAPESLPILRVRDLPAGKYELRIDDQPLGVFDAASLRQGVTITSGPDFEQAEELHAAIAEKNALYFYRYRPQNETYLFLFRKHEQGNNAVEIPQFEPLVQAQEKRIAELRVPGSHRYALVRQAP